MPAICQNYANWLNSGRNTGRAFAALAGTDTNVFGFDVNPDATNARGRAQCPSSWSTTHACPETNAAGIVIQPVVQPDSWPHTARETIDPLNLNEIQAEYFTDSSGQQVLSRRSGRYYTCEEWPPRSFVEGGVGTPGQGVLPEGDGGGGNTFCAPKLMDSNCAGEQIPQDESMKSEQDWQGNAHKKVAERLRTIASAQTGRPDLDNTAVLISVQTMRDSTLPPAGYKVFTNNAISYQYDVKLYKNTRRDVQNFTQLTPIEKIQYMSSLTWDDVYHAEGEHVAILANGTVAVYNGTDMYTEIKSLSDEYSALGGDYMIDEDIQLVSNDSLSAPTTSSNSSFATPGTRIMTSNTTASGNATIGGELQFGHQDIQDPPPYNILSLGTAYILGNLGIDSNTEGASNTSDALVVSNAISTDRGLTESKRAHFRRHASFHQHSHAAHPHHAAKVEKTPNAPTTPFTTSLHKRAEGPIQCGPGSLCKDDSCCGPEGKCGYKEQNCGTGCTSNCDAKAMCGIDSVDGKTRCGLNLCCSFYGWCGTEDVHCHDPEPQFAKTPCQQGFGSCQKFPSPSCSGRSASTGRRVGYYQGWNVRERKCDAVRPAQINTKGLTHLFYSFVFFDPSTFAILPMNDADPPLYREFTKLASNGLQTWVAIGGWSFSDPGVTHTAWSDMCATAAGRAAFIRSTISFMEEYGFQGADLDWEYPEDAKRGGRAGDGDNLVLLVKEMQAAFGGRFGLSLTLAPDYWYLRGFRPKAMQQYVDFMGFMSYDLHGPWDTDVKALGSIVRPQTDITEIYQNLKPLWFDGVDPSKINMGLAYYGRTYQLADASCGRMGCGFKGPGAAGECTAFQGVLSNREIQSMIKKDGLTPYFNETAMVKYVTYGGDSWVGYDDAETLALKEGFANSLCLGGLMIWSIDFDEGTGGDLPGDDDTPGGGSDLVWVSPEIWDKPNPEVYCQFPCTVVLPPYTKITTTSAYPIVTVTSSGYTTTITRPPMTVSVWWISTLVVGPSTSGQGSQGPQTISTGVTLLTTSTWPGFTTTDSSGRTIYTSATESRYPPPPFVTSAIPSITFFSGLPPRPTTKPYPTPCATLPGLCEPGENENEDEDDTPGDDSGDGDCKGKDCDSGGCQSSCGGCKLGLLCNICIGFDCIGCIGLDCVSCKGPLCNICIGANCFGCVGPQCATCKGPDCVSCTKGKCGSTTCSDLQCPAGTDPDPDEDEDEDEEEDENGQCWFVPSDPDDEPGSPGGGFPGSPTKSDGSGSPTQSPGDGGGGAGSPTRSGGSVGTSTPTRPAAPSSTPIQSPDFSDANSNKNTCYNNGQMATREHMVEAADRFCKTYDGITFGSNSFQAAIIGFGWQEVHKSGLNILVRLEAKNNCRWLMTKDECNKQFVGIIDGCDQEGIIDKQGGVRENNCLIWRIDPEQNADAEPPKPPPSPPPPTVPKQPEIKGENHPKFDFYTTSRAGFAGGGGITPWYFGQQTISYYGEYKVCFAAYGWSDSGGVSTTDMPGEVKGITKVFGKTCDYQNNGVDYDKAKRGDAVGSLKCDGWDDATCLKETQNFPCFGATMFVRATCLWGVKSISS